MNIMDIKWYLRFFEKSDDLKAGCIFLFIFLILGSVGTILYFASDEYSIRKMGDLAAESKTAAMSYDFNKAHEILIKLETMTKNSYEGKSIYNEAFDYVFNAEAMYLCAKGDNESLGRLVFLLSSIPIEGVGITEGTEYEAKYLVDGYEEHEKYILYVRRFNQKCNTLIDLAIANHNYNLVNKVFPLYKSVPNELDQGLSVSDGKREKQRISYSDEDKEKAKKKINVAVKNGIFPNITTEIK